MAKIRVTSPTRIDLAGGTLDLWPLYTFLNGAVTVNMAVNIFTYVEIEELPGPQIILDLKNIGFKKTFANAKQLFDFKNEKTHFIRPHIRFWKPETGLKITIDSESPVGGGLGGSSSITAGLSKAFSELYGKNLQDIELVRLSHNLEAEILRTPTGTQDYVPALRGGLNILRYEMDNLHLETRYFPNDILQKKGFLVYTGKPHNSGLNNWEVLKKAIQGHRSTLKCLNQLGLISNRVKDACIDEDWDSLEDLFDEEYKWRTSLTPAFTSPQIKKIKKMVGNRGAVKICGAGGGGCVLIWSEKKQEVLEKCRKHGFKVFDIKVVDNGCQIQKS